MAIPVILFGAFDRHNLGDLLLPHVAAALLPRRDLVFAGLAGRDLRPLGGHPVRALAELAAELAERPSALIHVGGEVLTCEAWHAAVMLLAPDQVNDTVAYLDARPQAKRRWVRAMLGVSDRAPYVAPRGLLRRVSTVIYTGVGGVDLDACAPAMRREVVAKLKAAAAVGVRDHRTLAHLADAGVAARLIPDPAVMVAELFGARIRRCAGDGEAGEVHRAFPQGYVAVQLSADFGDDRTLTEVAAQLDAIGLATGFGVVFFRAGAAPWHDDPECYRRVASRMRSPAVRLFTALDIWDICALIAGSRAYCGSSLHGRIVATAFARPRVNICRPARGERPGKQAAYAATWECAGVPATVEVQRIAHGIRRALDVDPARLRDAARRLAGEYRQAFAKIAARLQ